MNQYLEGAITADVSMPKYATELLNAISVTDKGK